MHSGSPVFGRCSSSQGNEVVVRAKWSKSRQPPSILFQAVKMAAVQAWQSVTWDSTKFLLMTLSEEDFTANIRCIILTAAKPAHVTWTQTPSK